MLNEYTAITTKIRGMHGKLLKKKDYIEISHLDSIRAFVSYLKQRPGYSDILKDVDANKVYRSYLEGLLNSSIYEDFNKLYHFANFKQRDFLKIYGITYEVNVLKKFLRKAFDISEIYEEVSTEYLDYLDRHSHLNLKALENVTTLTDFREALRGSMYHQPIRQLDSLKNPSLFDYETVLDTFAFTTIWHEKNKILKKDEQKIFEQIYGTKFDLLNIIFIYRYKRYYDLPPEQISTLLVPVNYRLSNNKIQQLLSAEDLEAFWRVLRETKYAKYVENLDNGLELESLYKELLDKIIQSNAKKDPYSIASIYNYLHEKEDEVDLLTTILEAIHYDRGPLEIQKIIGMKE
ncbi:V0D/AC39 family V-type ATPase subunit [Alkalibacterium kapii]|uniref:V0D/AC39 family V-type ATPase subunit n=1 Tax=Alkalibacterium kapii TaxID=426704 RepID=UPI0011BDE202|nr:V-type ATPase subunit [Alkalibacterium kapii]